MSRPKARAALLEALEQAMRKASAQGVLYGQSVANAVGISGSDLDCLDLLNFEGRVTAGRLAEVTGLTTGAITGVVDRLEKAGLVRRERDEADRRKVYIVILPASAARIGRYYLPLQEKMHKVWGTYSDAELQLLLRFATEGYKASVDATQALNGLIKEGTSKRETVRTPRRTR